MNIFQFYDKDLYRIPHRSEETGKAALPSGGTGRIYYGELNDVFDGNLYRAFTIFFGESVEYYITEEEGGVSRVAESGRLENHELNRQSGRNRFELINAMLWQQTMGEEDALHELMAQYERREKVNERLFRMM